MSNELVNFDVVKVRFVRVKMSSYVFNLGGQLRNKKAIIVRLLSLLLLPLYNLYKFSSRVIYNGRL